MATTMMAGSPAAMAAETVFLEPARRCPGYRREAGELVLTDATGAELLAFVPSPDPS